MYSVSGLPDFRDNPISFSRDSYHFFNDILNPSIDGAIDAWENVINYNEDIVRINRMQEFAMNDIAERFLMQLKVKIVRLKILS